MKDTIFSDNPPGSGAFEFDQRVADVFDDMVSRSVPGYATIQLLTADLALRFAELGTIYDIGCSTGATINSIRRRAARKIKLVGIDSSAPMVELCKERVSQIRDSSEIEIVHADVTKNTPYELGRAGAIVFNLTLQFVPLSERLRILKEAYQALAPGGALIAVEKTKEVNSTFDRMFIDYYHKFKGEMGYSALEISAKREALENVLIPLSRDENLDLLKRAGFQDIGTFFQWFNFCGFLGIKGQ